MSRHDWWRVKLATAHITVCSLCDREKKIQYDPVGHDGCVCYREYYKKRWLCRLCDIATGIEVTGSITEKTNVRQDLRQVGNEMKQMTGRQRPANLPQGQFWCPCGRQLSENAPPAIPTVPTPWPGNHNLIAPVPTPVTQRPQRTTKQCVKCCQYIVPPANVTQPTRRSARVADRRSGTQKARKHTMLGRSEKAHYGVNSKGFELRARGGWD